ncbi:MAG: universal stress protein [Thermoproteota archaeon]
MYKCIVAGYDGSNAGEYAVRRAAQLARTFGSKLYIVTVVPVPIMLLGEMMIPEAMDVEKYVEPAKRRLEELTARVREEYQVDVERLVITGDPAEKIVETAKERGCKLIVVGRRGRGFLERLFLGSVSSKVSSLSKDADVLIVSPSV